MKKINTLILISLVLPFAAMGQGSMDDATSTPGMMKEETAFKVKDYEVGGYGAPVVKMTRINETDGVLNGVKAAALINHTWSIGGAAYALVNNVPFAGYADRLELGYGGLDLDYMYQATNDITLSAGVLLGGGVTDFNDYTGNSDVIYLAEPEVSAQYAVNKNFKVALVAGYRGVTGSDIPGVTDANLSGFTYALAFNFGKF